MQVGDRVTFYFEDIDANELRELEAEVMVVHPDETIDLVVRPREDVQLNKTRVPRLTSSSPLPGFYAER